MENFEKEILQSKPFNLALIFNTFVGLIKSIKYIVKGIRFSVTHHRVIYFHITHTNVRPSSQDAWNRTCVN